MRRWIAIAAGAFALLLPASASAVGYTGGASYPDATGGTSFGAASTSRPVASLFQVSPLAVTAGHLPRVRFRVDEGGMSSVRVRLAIVPLVRGTGSPVSVPLGSFSTGRTTAVTWPSRPRLVAGRYLVRLHVVDPLGRTLLRAAATSGRQTLTVRKAPSKPKPKPEPTPAPTPTPSGSSAPPPGPSAPGEITPEAGTTAGVFPVAGPHSYGERFGAPRKGYSHQGQDVLAAEGTQIVAPTAGTITSTGYQQSAAGYWVLEHSGDGRDFFFAHCQSGSTTVTQGQAVAAGAPLCRVGHTGDATGPHLHFEIWVGGWRVGNGAPIDPLAQLKAWDGGAR
jgi:murein DD-endopeptidase MepM/ murein hydrolase activator NlpD